MMRPWIVVQHVEWEGPGRIVAEGRARGLDFEVRRMDRNDPLPQVAEVAGLVVMGGPMGVADIPNLPHLGAERTLLAAAVQHGVPVLGVCLGAQLLASALGARVARGPQPEVGPGEVRLTPEGLADPVLGPAGPHLPVFHWHGDTFELPAGTLLLASSPLYPHQAFRVAGRCAYGLQFHVEADAGLWRDWAAHLPPEVRIDAAHCRAVERAGAALLGRFFDLALRTGRAA